MNWFNGLGALQQVFFLIAVVSTLVLFLQMLALFIGLAGGDADVSYDGSTDIDYGIAGLKVLSVRGIISFLILLGWSGFALGGTDLHVAWVIGISFLIGLLSLFANALIMQQTARIQEHGNMEIKNALDKIGTVYIPIPPKNEGMGKITVTFQERMTELNAINEGDVPLKTGLLVKVVAIFDDTTVIVSKA
ncbi:MAG: hypothetical protein FWE36_01565 [Erysipelotrichales bacterium]|nr:hypothetical protein [Erysipelotrichales bacterium]